MVRIEYDPMGKVEVPIDKYWGAQTQRALQNFNISGRKWDEEIIKSIILIKKAAAEVNRDLNLLDPYKAQLIIKAADIILSNWNEFKDNFPLDIFQTGSGTSTNMNVNEVISNLACELGSKEKGSKFVHPNDDVNKGQSSNDVIPTSIRIASYKLSIRLINEIQKLIDVFKQKEQEFEGIIKTGRTHLMDATPIKLSQEFSGYRRQLELSIDRIKSVFPRLRELPIGGTAVGTGINTHKNFGKLMCEKINQYLKDEIGSYPEFIESVNHFEPQSSIDTLIELMCSIKVYCLALMKITNDIRWMGSGPVGGIGELFLPELQPGSSIMPGKVNPVVAEAVGMACSYCIGLEYSLNIVNQYSNFELSTTFPLVGFAISESVKILLNITDLVAKKLIAGLKPNIEKIEYILNYNPSLVTPLAKVLGYDKAYEIVKNSLKQKISIKQYILNNNILTEEQLNQLLDINQMV
ncbi:MAG: class II fumarate hydratase [Candidatus Calescibacterium sp.]|nr:class II fumarate hydratase [Candidatus Calescibacterium sp.]MCX7971734.1 class II fumarate hydratase [bacterium]MDW8195340.1 class II fumarate hydratase [Candidatus Calescibacterium sp.]